MSSYDPWQFAGRKSLPVEAHYTTDGEFESTRLDHSDYGRMHTAERAPCHRDCVPPFALNTAQLRKVLLLRALRYLRGGAAIDEVHNADWEQVNKRATERALRGHEIRPDAPRVQHEMQARHRAAISRAGGFLQLLAAIAYRSWNLGHDSVAVAQSLGIGPCNVRVALERMRASARELGFATGADRRTASRKRVDAIRQKRIVKRIAANAAVQEAARKPQPKPEPVSKPIPKPKPVRKVRRRVDLQKVVALRNRGLTFDAIAHEVGFCRMAIRRAVRRAGLQLPPAAAPKCYRPPLSSFDAARAVELFRNGQSISEIASQMGYRLGTGQNRVRNTLIRAGVYEPKRNRAA